MRPLTEDETKLVFGKLEKFIGTDGIRSLLDRPDEPYSLRLRTCDRVPRDRATLLRDTRARHTERRRVDGAGH